MFGKFEIIKDERVDDGEGRANKDTEELLACKFLILPFFVCGFPLRHSLEAFEDNPGELGYVDVIITELSQETAVSSIDGIMYYTQVSRVVVEGVTVDVVDDFAFGPVWDLMVESGHNEKSNGYLTGATIGTKIQVIVRIYVVEICTSFFVWPNSNVAFLTEGIKDGYLLVLDADVKDTPEDECRVDRGVALA